MRITLIGSCILGLCLWRLSYCGSRIESTDTSAALAQKLVIQRILDKSQFCVCSEIRVGYRVRLHDSFAADHIAHYDRGKKTLRIETDPGSGWAFGWDRVDEQVLQQVIRDGGQFSTFTKYRPQGRYVPARMAEQF